MSGGQEKKFSTLGPKLSGSKAQQYYGDKQRQIRIEMIVYIGPFIFLGWIGDQVCFLQIVTTLALPRWKCHDRYK